MSARADDQLWLLASLARGLGLEHLINLWSPPNLRVVGRRPDADLARCLLIGVESALIGPALAGVLALGGINPPVELPIGLTIGFGLAGALLPYVTLRADATRRRRGFNHALSAFLDLVAVNLAAGRGVEGALDTASEAGNGWAFTELRQALHRAKVNQPNLVTSHNERSGCSTALSY
jgi:Flp pilus assembly protein TadB